MDSERIFRDCRTTITLRSIEELPRCEKELDHQIVDYPDGSQATGRVFFLELYVQSNKLGTYSIPVIYAFVENAFFCSKKLFPQEGLISHVIHVRYGGGCGGGGKSSGVWLLNILNTISCECLITDSHYHRQSGDERIYELYPELSGDEDTKHLKQIRNIHSNMWSGHGDVSWNLVSNTKKNAE